MLKICRFHKPTFLSIFLASLNFYSCCGQANTSQSVIIDTEVNHASVKYEVDKETTINLKGSETLTIRPQSAAVLFKSNTENVGAVKYTLNGNLLVGSVVADEKDDVITGNLSKTNGTTALVNIGSTSKVFPATTTIKGNLTISQITQTDTKSFHVLQVGRNSSLDVVGQLKLTDLSFSSSSNLLNIAGSKSEAKAILKAEGLIIDNSSGNIALNLNYADLVMNDGKGSITIKNSTLGKGGIIGQNGEFKSGDLTIENSSFGGSAVSFYNSILNIGDLEISDSSFVFQKSSDNAIVNFKNSGTSTPINQSLIGDISVISTEQKNFITKGSTTQVVLIEQGSNVKFKENKGNILVSNINHQSQYQSTSGIGRQFFAVEVEYPLQNLNKITVTNVTTDLEQGTARLAETAAVKFETAKDDDVNLNKITVNGFTALNLDAAGLYIEKGKSFSLDEASIETINAKKKAYGIRHNSLQTFTSKQLTVSGISSQEDTSYGIYSPTGNFEISEEATVSDVSGLNAYGVRVEDATFKKLSVETVTSNKNSYGVVSTGVLSVSGLDISSVKASKVAIGVKAGQGTFHSLTINGVEAETAYALYVSQSKKEDDIEAKGVQVNPNKKPDSLVAIDGDVRTENLGILKMSLSSKQSYLTGGMSTDESSYLEANLSNGSRWNVVKNSNVSTLTLASDAVLDFVNVQKTGVSGYKTVTVDLFGGEGGGVVSMAANVETKENDFLHIKKFEGQQQILSIASSGEGKDDDESGVLIQVDENEGNFLLKNNKDGGAYIDLGVYNYVLVNRASQTASLAEGTEGTSGTEWFLKSTKEYSPTAEAVLAMAGMGGQQALYLSQVEDLRKRLGEVRMEAADGLWASVGYQKERIEGFVGTGFRNEVYKMNVGVDHQFSNWLIGANFKASRGKQKTRDTNYKATGNTHSEGINIYGSWSNGAGCYADLVLSLDHYNQDINTNMLSGEGVKGKLKNWAVGLSAEVGRKFSFGETKSWFAEPQLQISYYHVKGDSTTLSNGMEVKQKDFNALTGRLGAVVGKDFLDEKGSSKGQINVRAGVKQQFSGNQNITVNSIHFSDSLVGTRAYYGVGADWAPTKNLKVFGYVERENGAHYTKEIEAKVGLKWSF